MVGTLAPIFSLHSAHLLPQDQGTFEAGLLFLDWLHKTNQSAWQILPLNETQLENGSATKHVPSPYKGYGIGLAPKYLSSKYAKVKPTVQQTNEFIAENKDWLEDYVLFCSLRDVYGTDDWRTWDKPFRKRDKGALQEWANTHKVQIRFYIIQQWQLMQSYLELHRKAASLGISLVGDFPYYLSLRSPLVWAHQKAFHILSDGSVTEVSGIPNTATTYFGRQIWGHPLYNWEHKDKVMGLWKLRIKYLAELFETVRFDHAKGFFSYGVMVPEDETLDRYEDGPGADVFKELIDFGHAEGLQIFAEDSGDKTGELRECLKMLQLPGIKIYHFAMKQNDGIINDKYAAVQEYPKECVAYTTTHDTMTLLEYIDSLSSEQKNALAKTAQITFSDDPKVLAANIRTAIIQSPANTIIIPIQDWLLIKDRINRPGTELAIDDPNWRFVLDRPIEELPSVL